jgi:hypothetical protein
VCSGLAAGVDGIALNTHGPAEGAGLSPFRLVGGYVLKDGRRLGERRFSDITTAVVDDLYGKLLVIKETDAAGLVPVRA